jgi:hypothetical protein
MGKFLRVAGAAGLAWASSFSVEALPITSVHTEFLDSSGELVPGTITASLDLWKVPTALDSSNNVVLGAPIFVDAFSLGTDFTVVIPQAVVDTHAPFAATVTPGAPSSPFTIPGLNLVHGATFTLPQLNDWCSPTFPFEPGFFALALRGGCSFADKASNIEAANLAGALIVNNIPGAGAPGINLGSFTPHIPVLGLSFERGQEFLDIVNILGPDGVFNGPYIAFQARWDPDNPVSVPEPATLALLAAGVAALRLRRRQEAKHGAS